MHASRKCDLFLLCADLHCIGMFMIRRVDSFDGMQDIILVVCSKMVLLACLVVQ